jgi:hypothetical protein
VASSECSEIVHLTNGDGAAVALAHAGLPGAVVVYADPLHDGPLVDAGNTVEWTRRRARFLAEAGHGAEPEVRATLERWQADVERAQGAEEVVLWFEPDLFDQLLLARHLAAVALGTWAPRRLSLVCRDFHPTLGDVTALGYLSPAGARCLFEERSEVPDTAIDLARRTWSALCAPTPEGLVALAGQDTSPMPFLAAALGRWCAEYPSVEDGVSLTEHYTLVTLDPFPLDGVHVFRAVQRLEPRVFMGDASFFWRLRRLAAAAIPLVTAPVSGPLDACAHAPISLTEAGRRVARGEVDALRLNPLDRWIGGVHLTGSHAAWRWSRARHALVAGPAP